MEWKNNLEQLIKKSLNVGKAIIPDASILNKSGTSETRFRMLLRNEVKMTAIELIVFSEWLKTEPNMMVSTVEE